MRIKLLAETGETEALHDLDALIIHAHSVFMDTTRVHAAACKLDQPRIDGP
jgi:hypothetical protein